MSTTQHDEATRPGPIDAVPVRHPGRSIAIVLVSLVTIMVVVQLVTNPAFDWNFAFKAMRQAPVINGLLVGTLLVTIVSMVLGVLLGVVLAVMRMSENAILRIVSGAYSWFFRAIPRYVLLTLLGAAGAFFPQGIGIGVPFGAHLLRLFGGSGDLYFAHLDANRVFSSFAGAVLGMALSEAAYMAEIARSGIISVDKGQMEAAQALGMSSTQAMRRIILPQALRVIVPPTGNETIAMFKDTSLLSAIPLTAEMFFQMKQIGANYYRFLPVVIGATIYYLIIASVLMVGQSWLEKRFGRGHAPLSYTGADH